MGLQYRVTLTGTWSREDTLPEDVTMMRKLSYQLRYREASAVADARDFPVVVFTLRADQPKAGARKSQTRTGTFEAHVRLPVWKSGYQYLTAPQQRSRATQLLRWYLQDVTCRAPKVTVTQSNGRRVQH